MGFGAHVRSMSDRQVLNELLHDVEPEDLIKYGLIPEFVGRLPVVAVLDELDTSALVKILVEPKNALVKQYQKLLAMEGVELAFRGHALAAIPQPPLQPRTAAPRPRSVVYHAPP